MRAANTDHHYSPDSQQDNVSPTELLQLCQEFHQLGVHVSPQHRSYIEQHTQHQDSMWHHQHRLRLTAFNWQSHKAASNHTCCNLVKSLLYSEGFYTEATRRGTNHEDEAKQQNLEYLWSKRHSKESIKESELVVDPESPSLAYSPDGLVEIPRQEGGIGKIKCPYTA